MMNKKKILDISLSAGLPLILYAVLFTPDFTPVNELTITTVGAVGTVLVELFQIAIILAALVFGAGIKLSDTGLYSFKPCDLLKVLSGLVIIFVVFFALNLFFVSIGQSNNLKVKLQTSYFALAMMMLSIGYCEEFFFRVYAFESFRKYTSDRISATVSTLLFCCGHFYEGFAAVVIIFFLGLVFQYLYKKYRNIHIIALVHALFNVISTVISSSL